MNALPRETRGSGRWYEPRYEWRPWRPDYRFPFELGWRVYLIETARFIGQLAGATLFMALLPVIIIVVILIGIALALASQTDDGDDKKEPEPQPLFGIHSHLPDHHDQAVRESPYDIGSDDHPGA